MERSFHKMNCFKNYVFSIIFYLFLGSISKINGDIRVWKHSTQYNSPQNWRNGKIPCDTSTVVFPTDLEAEISFLPFKETKMSQLILPRTGVLNIPSAHSSIEFYDKSKTAACDGEDRLFKQLKKERWLDPNNWISITYKNNIAIPDLERIPCQYDTVQFPAGMEAAIEYPKVTVAIGAIKVNESAAGNVVEHSPVNILNIVINDQAECPLKSGCLCHPVKWEEDDRLEKETCDNERKHCKQVLCLTPIRPVGQCCDICGSVLSMKYTSGFSLEDFKVYIKNFLKKNNFDNIDFYVSKVWGDEIQLIFREKDEYSTVSNDAANQIKELIQKDVHLGLQFDSIHVSGQYYNPNGVSGIKALFLTLLGALVIIGGVYVATKNYNQYPILPPSLRDNLRLNSLPSLGTYSPFRNSGFSFASCWPFSSYSELDSTQNENMEFLPTSHINDNDGQNGDQEFENPLYNQEERVNDSTMDTEVESYELENDAQENSKGGNEDVPKIVKIDTSDLVEPLIEQIDLLDTSDTEDHVSNESLTSNAGQETSQENSLVDVTIADKEL
ncbi:protein amnionless [Chrysoperla carnea]|uniref:protein amnionless n=1 Tax=Chrysoperla carnea TaxID=189513 RepID=UPI001D064FD4|nr:protein amnionless [Chrysoperla carnea]